MTAPLQRTLSLLPSGASPGDMTLDQLGVYLRQHYRTREEDEREERHRLRDRLYRDGGVDEMKELIGSQFEDQEVANKRKKWARWSRFNNVTKRVVNELSVVYQDPAKRTVGGDADNVRYQKLLAHTQIHERARLVNRMLNLHRALLVGPRVLMPEGVDGPRKMVVDIVTPANSRLIVHPNDPTYVVAYAIRIRPKTNGVEANHAPSWIVWSDFESFLMTEDWKIISETYQGHELGRMPHVFVSLEPGTDGCPWPGDCGEDLIAADMAIWFTAVNLIKEVKSATKQPIVSGDGSSMMRGQIADSEVPIELPADMAISSQDMSMDLSLFRDTADHILEHVANNYGMSAALIKHQGTQSAEARELMRAPLKELRREQQVILRRFERDLAESMSAMAGQYMESDYRFSTDGWRIDFAESETPLTPKEELERFEHENRLLLTNQVDYMMERDPDLDEDSAKAVLERNATLKAFVAGIQREFMRISGGFAADQPPDGGHEDSSDAGSDGRGVTTTQKVDEATPAERAN